jgi:hypothetical protein
MCEPAQRSLPPATGHKLERERRVLPISRTAAARSRIRPDLIKRTGVAKMVQKWCENLQFVRFSPHLPASSAFARFIFRGRRVAEERKYRRVGVSARKEWRFRGRRWRIRRLPPLGAAWRRLPPLGGGGEEYQRVGVSAKGEQVCEQTRFLVYFVSLGIASFRFISLGIAWRWGAARSETAKDNACCVLRVAGALALASRLIPPFFPPSSKALPPSPRPRRTGWRTRGSFSAARKGAAGGPPKFFPSRRSYV